MAELLNCPEISDGNRNFSLSGASFFPKQVYASYGTPAGGFHTGYEPKGESLDLIKEVQAYYTEGNTAPALEYLTPIKGANCPQICSEIGSGQTTAKEAAEAYDEDCKKAAMQLGMWN